MMKKVFCVSVLLCLLIALSLVCSACGGDDGGKTTAATTTVTEPPITEHVHVEAIEPGCEPTCESDGYTESVYCRECGETLKEAKRLDPLSHDTVYHEGKEPTCEAAGWVAYETCMRCEHTTYCEIPMSGHDIAYYEAKAPTCEAVGCEAYEACTRCEHTTYREIPALGHELSYCEGKEPTCIESGHEAYELCKRCEYSTYVMLPANGHSETYHEPKAATCLTAGWYIYLTCSTPGCDWHYIEEEPALGHDPVYHGGQEATCLVGGWEEYYTCSRCTEYNTYQAIDALGHNAAQYPAKAATCTEVGHCAYEVCTRCADYNTYVEIPAIGHDYVYHAKKNPTCTENGHNAHKTCTRCDYSTMIEEYAYGHFTETIADIAPTCTDWGQTGGERCWVCSAVLVEPTGVEPQGHDLVPHDAKAATCEEYGWYAYDTCSRCDFTTLTEIPVLGHKLVPHDGKDATCLEHGWYAYNTCSRCDEYNTYKEIKALGHSEGVAYETRAATCVSKQIMQIDCHRCSTFMRTYETSISSDAHNVVIDSAVPPTCISDGLTQGKHCSLCHQVLLAQKTDPLQRIHRTVNGACAVCGAVEGTEGLEYALEYDEKSYIIVGLGDYTGDTLVIGTHNGLDVTAIYLDWEKTDRTQIKRIVFAEGSRCNSENGTNFVGWTGLESVTFAKDSCTRIAPSMFYDCTALKTVTFRDGCEFVPAYHADKVPSIGQYAFYNCTSLSSVTLPSSIGRINDAAFLGCSSLTYLYIPASVIEIGQSVTPYPALTVYTAHSAKPDGWRSDWNSAAAPVVWNAGSNAVADDGYIYTLQNGIRYGIKDGAATVAKQPRYLTSVSIPASITYGGQSYPVKAIGDSAFTDMPYLTSVTMANTVETIGISAFAGCDKLTSVTLSAGLTSIGGSAFLDCGNLTALTIPASVKVIDSYAFSGCMALALYVEAAEMPSGWSGINENALILDCKNNDKDGNGYAYTVVNGVRYKLKDGVAIVTRQTKGITVADISQTVDYHGAGYLVTAIEAQAFENRDLLTSVSIPAFVKVVEMAAFKGCDSLESVTFAAGSICQTIENAAFMECRALRSIALPAGLVSLAEQVFYSCSSLPAIALPASLESIGYLTFGYCTSLESVSFAAGSTCKTIGDQAFMGCSALTAFTLPASVKTVGYGMLTDCDALASITVEAGNTAYKAENNTLYTIDGKTLLCYAAKSPITVLVVPDGVTAIEYGAFSRASVLTGITLPSSLTYIHAEAFRGATAPAFDAIDGVRYADTFAIGYDGTSTVILLREGTLGIAEGAFKNKTALVSVTLPSTLREVAFEAFMGCTALKSVSFAAGSVCETIAASAFSGCISLSEIKIPASVKLIGSSAFRSCRAMTAAVFAAGSVCHTIHEYAFEGCTLLSSANLPDALTYMGMSAFANTAAPAEDGIRYFGNWAVAILMDRDTYVVREGTVGIGNLFGGNTGTVSVTLPASLLYIMDGAFRNCATLEGITVAADNLLYSSKDGDLYSKDGSILYQYAVGKTDTSFVAPEGLKVIASEAFYRANNLTSVNLTGVERIGEDAFFDCKKLSSVTVSSSLTAIEEGAFSFCKNLSYISTIPTSVTEMGRQVFDRCEKLVNIRVAHAEKPDGWADTWDYSAFNTFIVVWGFGSNS